MKAHEYARLLLAGPDLELVHVNSGEYGEGWTTANQAEAQTKSDAQDRGAYWRAEWGNEVLIVE